MHFDDASPLRRPQEHSSGRVSVDVAHEKVHAVDCADCAADASPDARIDRFTRTIAVDTEMTEDLRTKIIEIANKCPVHQTLEASSVVSTSVSTLQRQFSRDSDILGGSPLTTVPRSEPD